MKILTKNNGHSTIFPRRLPWAIAAAVMAAGMVAAPVYAQTEDDEASDNAMLEEVIVTATRREQALQDVPMSVTAFTGEQLEALQADNLDAMQGAVPNLNIVQGRGSNSSVNAFIRGVGQPDTLQTFDPAVGIYLDDVYMSRVQSSLFKLYDIERIEVLRGPQGTLYGKNTPGGAIRLITRNPGDQFEAKAAVLYGDYDRFEMKAYMAGPLTDNFSLGLSVLNDSRNGYVIDPLTGIDYNNDNSSMARVKGVWDVSDDVNITFSADYNKEDVRLTLGNAEAPLISLAYSADFLTVTPILRYVPPTTDWDFRSSTSMTDRPTQKTDHYGGNVTVAWDMDEHMTLKSITAYRNLDWKSYIDIDATTLQLGDVFVGIDQDQFSQELQLLGDSGDDVTWVTGAYYLKEKVPSHQEAYADDFLFYTTYPISFLRTIDDDLQTTSYAIFGQVDWAFAENWSLGAGLRWTREEKDYFRTTSTFSNILGNADPAFAFSDSDSWSDWTPTITLDYDMNQNVHWYGRLAKGFKSGGFNGRANSAADVSTFDPETVWTAEIGAKTRSTDGSLQANFAVFKSNYDDFQARVSVGDGIDFRFPVLNAAKLDIQGVEMELFWLPVESLSLAAQVGYLDSTYGDGGFYGADGIEDEPAFSPKWTGRLAGTYMLDMGESSLSLTAAVSYRDAMQLSVENSPVLTEDAYTLVDLLFNWTFADDHWSLYGGVKNLTDELYKVEGQDFRSVGNIQTAYYGDPEIWTLGVEYRY